MSQVLSAAVDANAVDSIPDECSCYRISPFSRCRVVELDYKLLENRLKSFETWPRAHPISKESLALAGFFYSGEGDKVQCHSCRLILKKFESTDIPWLEHARWGHKCKVVREKMKTL